MKSLEYVTDVLIIGSGAAGLSLALRLAEHCNVIVISKNQLHNCSTWYAQGGIAAVFADTDSINDHIDDTVRTGAGLCDDKAVEFIIGNARKCVDWLVQQGVLFDLVNDNKSSNNSYHLNLEGGHSHRRVLHSADTTGKAIATILINKVRKHSNIRILEQCNAVDLVTSNTIGLCGIKRVIGTYIWNSSKKQVERCYAHAAVVLATGGASNVYQYTTNPDISSGDGIAIAWRAGCRVANLEFNQFHPTSLFNPNAPNFLLTEALRGEGAYLYRPDGSRFMPDFDLRAELAPRDIIARAINYEMKRLEAKCMYLDISYKPKQVIINKFPNIYSKLLKINLDLTSQKIPIVPAAHYTCGGVIVDQYGRTDIDGLYAIGEVSYTGLHGANRLASNSLLECIVYGWSASLDIISNKLPTIVRKVHKLPPWHNYNNVSEIDTKLLKHNLQKLRLIMWNNVGIVRNSTLLDSALNSINLLTSEIEYYYDNVIISNNLLEIRNLLHIARLIVKSALLRKESRGLHYTLDYPTMQQHYSRPTILKP
ncbi:L-aspartate oxidase [Candidatus Palibaumannia cicadellinicola]|uniref:L-aspartate oxidase n=1 Tax=Candidatus Palibaumannia cicadellinicola TaxID=186490 RepID=A0A0K2BLD5_9GAMM|nr:L-aspartate oxidase [Candidatus Baumannia cicadellinicola]AKZ66135.1 L-aspartate oxidase [Candidatus Baumannia cicadellinicola]